jgi:hypothetical protein
MGELRFNDATSNLNSGLLGVMCKAMGRTARARHSWRRFSTTHGRTILLRCARAATTASAGDDKNARSEHYRAQKHFGVVVDAGGLGMGSRPLQYWLYIGVASGSLTAQQLKEAGLSCEGLIGQACVINGLGEVERIGNHRVIECDAA